MASNVIKDRSNAIRAARPLMATTGVNAIITTVAGGYIVSRVDEGEPDDPVAPAAPAAPAKQHPADVTATNAAAVPAVIVDAAAAKQARKARTPAAKLPPQPKPAKAATAPKEAKTPKAQRAPGGAAAERLAQAQAGNLPVPPDFSADTHKRFRAKLDALVAMAAAGDVAGLEAFEINPISSSRQAMDRYRKLAVIALRAKQAPTA